MDSSSLSSYHEASLEAASSLSSSKSGSLKFSSKQIEIDEKWRLIDEWF